MSTKNLSRTVIEGGRYHRNCWERRESHSRERAATRAVLSRIRHGDDGDDDCFEPRPHVGKAFYDKLAPAERWLRAQIGRPWDKVRAELFARFDTRTTAGRHIVFDHLLRWVRIDAVTTWWSFGYVVKVGKRGILQPIDPPGRRARGGG